MASYPTCVRCHGTESELDVDGVCTTCHSRGSGRETPGLGRPRVANLAKTVLVEDTRTIPPFEINGAGTATIDADRPPIPPPVLPPNVRFTHYTDLQFIDRGGMGLVYKAVQTNANRIVALKIMNPIAQSDSRQEKRFKTEAEALARLSHPGIVQIYDVGHENGVAFFSMEYVSGGPLSKRIKAGPKIAPREAAELMAGVSSAIAAAHAVGVVHRDVKPSNILLNDIGKPKVTDFGLAALADSTARMTNTGALLGTPSYMSPEQASGRYDDVGPRSDVYSLGATLYELLTGKPPFVADTPVATAMKVCNDRVVRPREIEPKVPGDLEGICLKCLEKNPLDRYPTAAGLANDLSRYLRGEPVRPLSPVQKALRWTKRHQVATVAPLLLVLAGLLLFALWPLGEKEKIDRDLINGKEVILVKDKGMPRWHRWELGAANLDLRDSPNGDGAVGFDAKQLSLLELGSDTFRDRYTFEAEIQHVKNFEYSGCVGVYLMSRSEGNVRHWQSVQFSDFPTRPPGVQEEVKPVGLRLRDRLSIFHPTYVDVPGISNTSKGEYFEFMPSNPDQRAENLNPAMWRLIHVVVTPEFVEVYWRDGPNGMNGPVMRKPADRFPVYQQAFQRTLDKDFPDQNRIAPPWSARGSVGIFATKAAIAFKNVRLIPASPP
jgi:predicted Ser/Thr protein kinase